MDLFKTNCCFDYKVTGIGVGVVGIALTIGFAAFFGPILLLFGDVIIVLVTVSMLGMHFVINSKKIQMLINFQSFFSSEFGL